MFLKPNFAWKEPTPGGITTPADIKGVVTVFKDAGAEILIGETDGGYALFFSPHNPEAVAQMVLQGFREGGEMQSLVRQEEIHARRLSWDEHAATILQILQNGSR